MDRAKKFYTDAFGWKMEQMGAEMGNYIVVETAPANSPGANNGVIFKNQGIKQVLNGYSCVVSVDDIDKAAAAVTAAGGKVLDKKMEIPTIGWYVKCQDTEGNYFSLLQAAPRA